MEVSKDLLDFDELKMYFTGFDYRVNEYLSIKSPTVGEIIEMGEPEYWSMLRIFTGNPSDMISVLWDMGVDWEKISDYELFYSSVTGLPTQSTKILFGENVDFTALKPYKNESNGGIVLADPKDGHIVIDELAYIKISSYLRKIHDIKPKIKHSSTKTVKRLLIQVDRDEREQAKKKPYKSVLRPLVSAMMRYPGFKYKSNELKEITLYEFMDTVRGSQIYVSSTALLQGSYSGMVDTKKIDKKNFDWLRDPAKA